MRFNLVRPGRIFFIISAVLAILFISSALFSPAYISNIEKNWAKELSEKNLYNSSIIQEAFNNQSAQVISAGRNIKKEIKRERDLSNQEKIFRIILDKKNNGLSIQVYRDEKLFVWNSDPIIDSSKIITFYNTAGQTWLFNKKLFMYLSFADTININKEKFLLTISKPIHRFYNLQTDHYSKTDFVDSLTNVLKTDIQIDITGNSEVVKDGRKYELPLLNNLNNKIATVSFTKPSLNETLNDIKEDFSLIQSLLLIFFVLLVSFFVSRVVLTNRLRTIRFTGIVIIILGLRALLFLLEIPSFYFRNELTDASNFSSQFAFGMVRSPLEFLFTGISLLAVSFYAYYLLLNYYKSSECKKSAGYIKPVVVTLISIFLILLLWRSFGATVKSVVFDSTIRYFKDFTLTPSPAVLLMCVNILVLGLIVFLSSLALSILIFSNLSSRKKSLQLRLFYTLFFVIQISGLIYDVMQHDPQGTHLIRFFFFTILFVNLYQIIFREREFIFKFVLYSITASIISVSLLTFYNSELERESLRTTAYDLVRLNSDQIQFIVFQTLLQVKSDFNKNKNEIFDEDVNSRAFIIWSKSLLYREGVSSSIEYYDRDKKYIGGFTTGEYLTPGNSSRFMDSNAEIKIVPQNNIYNSQNLITGFITLKDENEVLGYLCINVTFSEDHYNFSNLPKLLKAERAGISSALDQEAIRFFDFHDDTLVSSYSDLNLSKSDEFNITHARFNSINEAWTEIKSGDEKNLVFAIKQNTNSGEKIIAVSRGEKSFTWNLTDFFKIFFIHTILIFLITFLFFLINFRLVINKTVSFRVKLITALLFISIIPLFIIAAYIRGLTEEKNDELLSKILAGKGKQVVEYLDSYLTGSNVDWNYLFEKANKDLKTNFSIYSYDKLAYSSYTSFYQAGLLNEKINPEAFDKLLLQKYSVYSGRENIEGKTYATSYHMVEAFGKKYIIVINELFNPVALPLSSVELDIFLFGIFSFAVVLIIVISAFLSGQISLPIKRLTTATRAVANGDYNIEVDVKGKGEIRELADGFNLMVQKVKQSQLEIAQFEREEAWREMAKQVAHEIKNPLTPMKLSIQQLVAAYKDKSPKFDSIFVKVTETIASQIETLKNIASEFSNFARMPGIRIEKINLTLAIQQVVDLFINDKQNISFEHNDQMIIVNADLDHLKRAIVNLIRNSIQAKATHILVRANKENNNCLLRISDNGVGITDAILPNIFNENYTTKKSGMGLGLSMAKKYFESIQGKIFVENTSSGGTTFLIIIPLAE